MTKNVAHNYFYSSFVLCPLALSLMILTRKPSPVSISYSVGCQFNMTMGTVHQPLKFPGRGIFFFFFAFSLNHLNYF